MGTPMDRKGGLSRRRVSRGSSLPFYDGAGPSGARERDPPPTQREACTGGLARGVRASTASRRDRVGVFVCMFSCRLMVYFGLGCVGNMVGVGTARQVCLRSRQALCVRVCVFVRVRACACVRVRV